MNRRQTKQIHIGSVAIGGGHPVAVQSMTNTKTHDRDATVAQLQCLEAAGCDIARIAFTTVDECALIRDLRATTAMPLVADVQYDYRIALAAIDQGIDKVRFNPGNIGDAKRVEEIYRAASQARIPVRIGVNSGSLPHDIEQSDRSPEQKLVEACLQHVRFAEDHGFTDLVLSVKSSRPDIATRAYRLLSDACAYPLHLGVTEAGVYEDALVRSSIALGGLLCDGIGDTIRVSVTGDVVDEIKAARLILKHSGATEQCCTIVSCPTCARTGFDLVRFEQRVRERYGSLQRKLRLAVMGCAVNGPGEAKDADFGITGGDGKGVIFQKGKIVAVCAEDELFDRFTALVDAYLEQSHE